MRTFSRKDLKSLYQPDWGSSNEDNGQVTIIGGSTLFHGAPILSLKAASRLVDMVFFMSPEPSVGTVAERIKAELSSFIWVPWDEVDEYIKKSDALLIGPGMMRFSSEARNSKLEARSSILDSTGKETKDITEKLLNMFPDKRWVIDAGSLQVISPKLLPEGCIITPNKKEFELLFGIRVEEQESGRVKVVGKQAKKHKCVIVLKGPETIVCSSDKSTLIKGGNPGLTKGGTGDVLAGLTVALMAKNNPYLAAASASYIVKKAGDELYEKVGVSYNADDLAEKIPEVFNKLAS
jgi:NAD(P)H-hydrate epimerase